MRSVFFVCFCAISLWGSAQKTESDPSLTYNDDYINWVRSVLFNEWDVKTDMQQQLGARLFEFRDVLSTAQNPDEVNSIIAKFGYDPEYGDQKMAEHLTYGLYFKQQLPSIWERDPETRTMRIRNAYYEGMSSNDSRWIALKSELMSKIQFHCGTNRMPSMDEIIDCFWDTLRSVVDVVGSFAGLVTAINNGNWNAAVAAIKKIIKTGGRK